MSSAASPVPRSDRSTAEEYHPSGAADWCLPWAVGYTEVLMGGDDRFPGLRRSFWENYVRRHLALYITFLHFPNFHFNFHSTIFHLYLELRFVNQVSNKNEYIIIVEQGP